MKVGICLIVKNVNLKHFKEFLAWHRAIGIDYFFTYDNDSDIPLKRVFEHEKRNDDLFIYEAPGDRQQLVAYNDCLSRQKRNIPPKCDWLAFIDEDEFIVPEKGDLKSVLNLYSKYGGVGINWLVFGSSGLKSKSDQKQICKFTQTLPPNHELNRHIKSIVRPKRVETFLDPHHCQFKKDFFGRSWHCVNVEKEIVEGPWTGKPIHKKLWLNHYFFRSEEEFKEKITRGELTH